MMNKTPSLYLSVACAIATGIASAQAPQLPDPTDRYGAYRGEHGAVHADGATFHADFTRDVVSMQATRDGDGAQPRLDLRYLGSRRGAHHAPAGEARDPHLSGEFVRYHRGDVVETYEVTSDGYEQSFQLLHEPQGEGDLVLRIAVDGNVQADACRPAHRALEFRHEGARAIRYGEAIAFGRGGERVEVMTSYDGQGVIELTVPAALVDGAVYPLTIDPAVGPVLQPGGPGSNDTQPDVAYDLESGRYMVTWLRTVNATSRQVMCQTFDRDGVALTGPISVVFGGANIEGPAIAACNKLNVGNFMIVWSQNGQIRARVMTDLGFAVAASFGVSLPSAGEADTEPTVSGPGDGAMMVAWARSIGGGDPTEIVLRDVYWTNPAQPLNPAQGPERVLHSVTSGYVGQPRLARSDVTMSLAGVEWHANRIIWQQFYTSPAPGDFDVLTTSFRLATAPYDFALMSSISGVANGGADIGPNEFFADIGSRASQHGGGATDMQFCIAWQDESDVLATMYDLYGPVGGQITIRDTSNFEGRPAVGAGACEFTVAYTEIIPPNEFAVDIRAARVLLDGTVAITDRAVDVLDGPFQSGLRASSRPISDAPVQLINTSLLAWSGQTGTGAAINDIRARFFQPNEAYTSLYGTACAGPAGELPQIGSTGGKPIAGNTDFAFTLSDAPPLSIALLVVGDVYANVPIPGAPGCELYMGLPIVASFAAVTDPLGNSTVPLTFPCSVPHGAALAFQFGIYVPGHNPLGWITSNDMDVSWSHN